MKTFLIISVLLATATLPNEVEAKRGFSLGGGRKKTSSSSSTSWFNFGSKTTKTNTQAASIPSAPPAPKPAGSGYGWSAPGGSNHQTSGFGSHGNKAAANSHQPSSNIGPGGYPVQGGVQRSPPPYSPTNTHGTSIGHAKPAPPSYSASNPHASPPSYNSHYPKKQIINNHYHYNGPPPAYSQPSHFGMNSAYYPPQNGFGYPGGGFFGGSKPRYGGMGMFSSGMGGYGYPGSGSWGGYPSYGSSGKGSLVKGMLIGAAGGYLVSSLVRRITNPWGYSGHGYGYGYQDRYRDMGYYDRNQPTPAPVIIDPTKDWINCVAYDPATRVTMINPNCSCTVSVTTDPNTGQNISHHDCTPFAKDAPPFIPQPPLPTFGVNNPPPSFNGSMYGADMAYGGGGYAQPVAPVQNGDAMAPAQTAPASFGPLEVMTSTDGPSPGGQDAVGSGGTVEAQTASPAERLLADPDFIRKAYESFLKQQQQNS